MIQPRGAPGAIIEQQRGRHPAVVLGLVLFIHAGLLAALKTPDRPQDAAEEARHPPMVWLAPIKPVQPLAPAAPRPAPRAKTREYAPAARAATPATPAVPPPAPAIAQPQAITPPAVPETNPEAPAFDMDAALKSARVLATRRAGKDDIPLDQFKDRPLNELRTESRLGKDIARSARPDCLKSFAGAGTLAPLAMAAAILTDKKDSGCKW